MTAGLAAQGQSGGTNWQPGTSVASPPISGGATNQKRPSPDTKAVRKDGPAGTIKLSAILTDDGQSIDQGIAWHVFHDKPDGDGKRRLVRSFKEATPQVSLPAGEYIVTASFGRAHLTRRVTVGAGEPKSEVFVLNAGGLRVSAVLNGGEPAPEKSVVYEVLSDEREQSGQRKRIMSGGRIGLIYRLNAGLYHIVSTYGDANAIVHSDVAVEAGKLTEVNIAHSGARVTLKLVTRTGGEALTDTQWSIANTHGETVKESAGALPSHILAAGTYIVTARQAGRTFKREFKVQGGDNTHVELVIQ